MRELIGDAWEELTGYDGRFVRTFRRLLRQPGSLTLEVLEGRRARYVSPVRIYLVASVLYFVIAAAAPNVRQPAAPVLPGSNVTIDLRDPEASTRRLSPEQRAEALKSVERAPWWGRPLLRAAVLDPAGFRRRVAEAVPRMLFALVPVFAGIVSLFYRGRQFSQHLIFALHVHTVVFLGQAVRASANFTGSLVAVYVTAAIVSLLVVGYALRAFRKVYAESWPWILAKAAAIAVLYAIAAALAMAVVMVTVVWRG